MSFDRIYRQLGEDSLEQTMSLAAVCLPADSEVSQSHPIGDTTSGIERCTDDRSTIQSIFWILMRVFWYFLMKNCLCISEINLKIVKVRPKGYVNFSMENLIPEGPALSSL
jgi:hypothetical protein